MRNAEFWIAWRWLMDFWLVLGEQKSSAWVERVPIRNFKVQTDSLQLRTLFGPAKPSDWIRHLRF